MNILLGLSIPALAVLAIWLGQRQAASMQRKGKWSK